MKEILLDLAAQAVVYRDSPTSGGYHAQRSDGTEIAVNQNDPDPVIQAALDQSFLQDPQSGHGPGDIYIQSGTYSLSSGFIGLNVYSYTRLTLDPTARLIVPSGYAGSVFQLLSDDRSGVVHTMIDGGIIGESSPPQQQWTGFLLKASAATNSSGILFNKIANTVIFSAKVGIELLVDGSKGFINSNTFQFLRMWGNQTFVDFEIGPPYVAGEEDFGILGNLFFDLQCEVDSTTSAGTHNITGFHNTFLEVKVWDIQVGVAGAKRANIVPEASNTLISRGDFGWWIRCF
jgi:hypothetical protein